jgi:hypothetical protein
MLVVRKSVHVHFVGSECTLGLEHTNWPGWALRSTLTDQTSTPQDVACWAKMSNQLEWSCRIVVMASENKRAG